MGTKPSPHCCYAVTVRSNGTPQLHAREDFKVRDAEGLPALLPWPDGAIGTVYRSTSGAVWGSMSCTPRLQVWAWQANHAPRPQGSAGGPMKSAGYLIAAREERIRMSFLKCPRCGAELIEHWHGGRCEERECGGIGKAILLCTRAIVDSRTCGWSGCPAILPLYAPARARLLGVLQQRAAELAELDDLALEFDELDLQLRLLGERVRAETEDEQGAAHLRNLQKLFAAEGPSPAVQQLLAACDEQVAGEHEAELAAAVGPRQRGAVAVRYDPANPTPEEVAEIIAPAMRELDRLQRDDEIDAAWLRNSERLLREVRGSGLSRLFDEVRPSASIGRKRWTLGRTRVRRRRERSGVSKRRSERRARRLRAWFRKLSNMLLRGAVGGMRWYVEASEALWLEVWRSKLLGVLRRRAEQ